MELQYGAQLLCHFLAFHGVPLGNHPIHNKNKHVQEIFIELFFVLNSCLVEKLCIAENSNLKLHSYGVVELQRVTTRPFVMTSDTLFFVST
jgi:hypothetical protein